VSAFVYPFCGIFVQCYKFLSWSYLPTTTSGPTAEPNLTKLWRPLDGGVARSPCSQLHGAVEAGLVESLHCFDPQAAARLEQRPGGTRFERAARLPGPPTRDFDTRRAVLFDQARAAARLRPLRERLLQAIRAP